MSLREKIFAAKDLKEETVNVPEWDVDILLRAMGADEALALTELTNKTPDDGMFLIVIYCAYDPSTGDKAFSLEDLPELKKKFMPVIDRLQRVCLKLNGMLRSQEDSLKKD